MFDDYRAAVLATYQDLQAAGKLSSHLNPLTRSGLKKACAVVLDERYRKEDEKALRDFFGSRENQTAYMLAINQCDAEKFKTLQKFLKAEYTTTNNTNIELLAWLVDFQPRPYQSGRSYAVVSDSQGEKAGVIATKQEGETFIPKQDTPVSTGAEPKKKGGKQKRGSLFKSRLGWMLLLVPVGLLIGLYLSVNKDGARSVQGVFHPGIKECMYWTGDHYEAIACDQKKGDTAIIAIDTFRLVHLKKINKPDTLTAFSLGKVWYIKLNGNVEFYTSAGLHPVYPERRLKPLTEYILNKYVRHQ